MPTQVTKQGPREKVKNHPGLYSRVAADGSKRYILYYRAKNRRQYTRTFLTIGEAEDFRAANRPKKRKPLAKVKCADYFRLWIESHDGHRERFDDSTRIAYRRSLDQFAIPFFGNTLMQEVEPRDIRLFVKHLKDYRTAQGPPLSIASVVKNLSGSRARLPLLRRTALSTLTPLSVSESSAHKKVDDGDDVRIPTKDEFARLLTATPAFHKLLVTLCGSTGLRSSRVDRT